MRITIRIKPNSKATGVFEEEGNEYVVKVSSPAREGKANGELIELLANYFKISKSNIKIISGFKSRKKIIEINE